MSETPPLASDRAKPAEANLLETIRAWGHELGFQALGFTGIDLADHEGYLSKWLDAGYHGDMEWMARHGAKRSQPDALVPGT